MIDFFDSVDKSLFRFINSHHASWLNPVMVKVSGQLVWYPILAWFFYVAFQRFGKKKTMIFAFFILMAIIAADTTSSQIIKNIFMRLRPCRQDDLLNGMNRFGQKCGGRFGFVSSHASNTFAAMIFIVLALDLPKKTKYLALCFPVIVSYSRIYLGVHFPGDVIGGAIIGIIWGHFFAWAFKNLQGAKRESSQV